MQRRYGRSRRKRQGAAWELTALLLLALLGISLVSEPESGTAGNTTTDPSAITARHEAQSTPAFADRAYALSVGDGEEAEDDRPSEAQPKTGKD